jgi:hypothetical protein
VQVGLQRVLEAPLGRVVEARRHDFLVAAVGAVPPLVRARVLFHRRVGVLPAGAEGQIVGEVEPVADAERTRLVAALAIDH